MAGPSGVPIGLDYGLRLVDHAPMRTPERPPSGSDSGDASRPGRRPQRYGRRERSHEASVEAQDPFENRRDAVVIVDRTCGCKPTRNARLVRRSVIPRPAA
jgi:hypothetical protein